MLTPIALGVEAAYGLPTQARIDSTTEDIVSWQAAELWAMMFS